MVEQRLCNPQVIGSSPISSSICGRSVMVTPQSSKLILRVRIPPVTPLAVKSQTSFLGAAVGHAAAPLFLRPLSSAVEQLAHNRSVLGSNPRGATTNSLKEKLRWELSSVFCLESCLAGRCMDFIWNSSAKSGK